jgi:type III secretion protein T
MNTHSFLWGLSSDHILLLALSCTRLAITFMMLPLFAGELLPATVRNAMMVVFGTVALFLQPQPQHDTLAHLSWLWLFGKEVFLGASLGFLFGAMLWAFEAAGQLIDTKIGATSAQLTDPFSGQQVPLTGAFLGRLANFVFMFSGGFLLLLGMVMDSYTLWPVLSPKPLAIQTASMVLFENELGRLMRLTLLLAAPSLVILFAVDAVLGLVNRFASQLNVSALSMSIKTSASVVVLLLTVGSLSDQLLSDIQSRPRTVLQKLRGYF